MTLLTVTLLSSASMLAMLKAVLLALAIAWTIRDFNEKENALNQGIGSYYAVVTK